MIRTGVIGLAADAPVTAHPTTDALAMSLRELFKTTWISPDFAGPEPGEKARIRESDTSAVVAEIKENLVEARRAAENFCERELLANPQGAEQIRTDLRSFLSGCDCFSEAIDGAVEAHRIQDFQTQYDCTNTAWLQLEVLERHWLRIEFQQILDDPFSGKNLPADPYRWVFGMPSYHEAVPTKGIRFQSATERYVEAQKDCETLQKTIAEFSQQVRGAPRALSESALKETARGIHDYAKRLAEFLPFQHARIEIHRNQFLAELPVVDGAGVDPQVYVTARDISALKHSALLNLGTDTTGLAMLAQTLYALSSDDKDRALKLEAICAELEFVSISIAARLRLSDPVFLGTQRSYDERGPADPLVVKRAREARPLDQRRTYLESWNPTPLFLLIDSRMSPEALNAAMRGAGYGTRADGVTWPTYFEVASETLSHGNQLDPYRIQTGRGARRQRGVVPTLDGLPLIVWQYEGRPLDGWKLEPTRPGLDSTVLKQTQMLQSDARSGLNEKGTTLGEHTIAERMNIPGAKFFALEELGEAEVGFCYMFVDPALFPDREEIAKIPAELLPAGRASRPNLIVVAEGVKDRVEDGAAYTALMNAMEDAAAECGCDYMIARVNTHEGSRGWRAAERRGWKKIDARTSYWGELDGKPVLVEQQWIVKVLE